MAEKLCPNCTRETKRCKIIVNPNVNPPSLARLVREGRSKYYRCGLRVPANQLALAQQYCSAYPQNNSKS